MKKLKIHLLFLIKKHKINFSFAKFQFILKNRILNNNNVFKQCEKFFIMIIIYKRIFERVREKNDRDSNFKFFENKNAKVSFLNSRISKFNKLNYDDNVNILYIYKSDKNKRKNEFEIEYKNFIYFHYNKKGYIKLNYSNKDKSIIYIVIITIKNDSIL